MLVRNDSSMEESFGFQASLSNYHSSPPIINTLPVEILTDILRYLQPETFFPLPDIPPLVHLICVCRHWRTVALNVPSLWSTITLENPKYFHIAMVRQWLERSNNCPLALSLTVCGYGLLGPDVMRARVEKILSLLIQHLRRWQSITLDFTNLPIYPHSCLLDLPVSQTAAPLLEKVNVRHRDSFTPEASLKFWEAIGGHHSAHQIVWSEGLIGKTYLPNALSAPWENLTHLTSHFIVDDALLALLSGSPALEVLNILSLDESGSTLGPRGCICIPHLHTLSCSFSALIPLSRLLDHLDLPKLKSLRMNEWWYGNPWTSFLQRPSCFLRSLSVRLDKSSEEDIRQLLLLPCMTALERLDAWKVRAGDSLLQTLTWKPGMTTLPALRQLRLYVGGFQDGLLAGMLKSRLSDSTCPLEKAAFHLFQPRGERGIGLEVQFLKNLHKDGLAVEYRL